MQYRQDVMQGAVQRNYYLNCSHAKYLAQIVRRFVYVLENFYSKFANLVESPTNGTTKRLLRCKVHLVL